MGVEKLGDNRINIIETKEKRFAKDFEKAIKWDFILALINNKIRFFSREKVCDVLGKNGLNNLKGYKRALKLIRAMGSVALVKPCYQLFYAYYSLVMHPKMFNYMKDLVEIDSLHEIVFGIRLNEIKTVKQNEPGFFK